MSAVDVVCIDNTSLTTHAYNCVHQESLGFLNRYHLGQSNKISFTEASGYHATITDSVLGKVPLAVGDLAYFEAPQPDYYGSQRQQAVLAYAIAQATRHRATPYLLIGTVPLECITGPDRKVLNKVAETYIRPICSDDLTLGAGSGFVVSRNHALKEFVSSLDDSEVFAVLDVSDRLRLSVFFGNNEFNSIQEFDLSCVRDYLMSLQGQDDYPVDEVFSGLDVTPILESAQALVSSVESQLRGKTLYVHGEFGKAVGARLGLKDTKVTFCTPKQILTGLYRILKSSSEYQEWIG